MRRVEAGVLFHLPLTTDDRDERPVSPWPDLEGGVRHEDGKAPHFHESKDHAECALAPRVGR